MAKTRETASSEGVVQRNIFEIKFASEAPPELGLQVRKAPGNEGYEQLKASVAAHGIIVPLAIKEHDGEWYTIAGNRRLRALRELHQESGRHPDEATAPTVNSDDFPGDTREIAMATNLGLPQHPVDRYEVIATLVEEGMTPGDAQARFGMTPRMFAQTMRLAELSPTIREAWRAGEIDASIAKAFALTSDQALQDRTFKAAVKDDRISEHFIRHRMVEKQHDVGKLVEFLGVQVCEAQGIRVNEDLFGTSHTIGASDVAKLRKAAYDRLLVECDILTASGWSWATPLADVENQYHYSSIIPETDTKPNKQERARLQEITDVLAAGHGDTLSAAEEVLSKEFQNIELLVKNRGFSDKQRAKAGCFVDITDEGHLKVQFGRVKPEQRRAVQASEKRAAAGGTKAATEKKAKPALSSALANRLSLTLTRAAATALIRQPHVAAAALITGFAAAHGPVRVSIDGDPASEKVDFAAMLKSNVKQTPETLSVLIAQIAAQAVSFSTWNQDKPPMLNKDVSTLVELLDAKTFYKALREHAFDAKDYFNSISKDMITHAVLEAMGEDHAKNVAKLDKSKAAAFAIANVPKTSWLPEWLRTSKYDGPEPKKAKATPAKAKPVKKAPAKKKRK